MQIKVLYVDDEQDNLKAFKAVFRRSFTIDVASSGAEALDLIKKESYAVVISDQRMPQMTGVQLFEVLNESNPEIIRIILTGYSDTESIVNAINKGKIYYYVTKPWRFEELKIIIEKAIETYLLRKNNEELKNENILAQFEILKNQINPHFLFNSMNILSSLIINHPEKAVQFTNSFSKLYRTVLNLKDQVLISLEEELDFVYAFIDLQKIRFENAFQIKIETIEKDLLALGIPPFSLQLVIENAIKHNILSQQQPLHISLKCIENKIIIRNNIQLRSHIISSKTGHRNILSRYKLIGADAPVFLHKDTHYECILPLI